MIKNTESAKGHSITVLVATLDHNDINQLVDEMNLSNVDTIVVHQSKKTKQTKRIEKKEKLTVLYSDRIGLSASRNDAVRLADDHAICQIADDDTIFVDHYPDIVKEAYDLYPDADVIVFYGHRHKKNTGRNPLPKGRLSYLHALNVFSSQITFKKSSLVKHHIYFDERFGIGSTFGFGEENILLFDCLRNKLKIYSYPIKIADIIERESHWDQTNNKAMCIKRGAVYKRMAPHFYWLFILSYAIRKRKRMPPDIPFFTNISYMLEGAAQFSRDHSH